MQLSIAQYTARSAAAQAAKPSCLRIYGSVRPQGILEWSILE
jgi:hypothetical protein